jgi:hypothetical protein
MSLEAAPFVPHPRWCNPRSCSVQPEPDGAVMAFHRLAVLGDPLRLAGPGVEIIAVEHRDAAGTILPAYSEPARIFLRDLDDVAMTGPQAGGLAAALALASAVLGASGGAR